MSIDTPYLSKALPAKLLVFI